MRQVARATAGVAAIVWLVGAPLLVMAGVPFTSDAQYVVLGAIAGLLGLMLAPVAVAMGRPTRPMTRTVVRFSGLAVCVMLAVSGLILVLAATGRIGEHVTHLVPDAVALGFVALFVWIASASAAMRGPSKVERSTCWLGLITFGSFVLSFLAGPLVSYLAQDVVPTGATVFPSMLIELCVWLTLPAWLIAVIVRLSRAKA